MPEKEDVREERNGKSWRRFPNALSYAPDSGSRGTSRIFAFASREIQSAYPGTLDVIIEDMVVGIDLFNDPYGVLQGLGKLLLFMVRKRGLSCPLIFQKGKDI